MRRSVFTIAAVFIVIGFMVFSSFFGLNLGPIRVDSVDDGIKQGLDLVGGSEITYEAIIPENLGANELAEGMETAKTMLRQRLNNLGYTEANIYLSGNKRIVLEIPNVSDPEEAVQLLGSTAVIRFVDSDGNIILEGGDISSATAAYGQIDDTGAAKYYVKLQLNEQGASKFKEGTKAAANQANPSNRYVAITLDGNVISSPTVGTEYAATGIDTDTPIITLGSSSNMEYAKYLAGIISAGQLPFELREAKLQAVGASLGERSLETAVMAGLIGIILIMLFMVIVYMVPGLVANLSLLLYISLFLVVMSAARLNLTLPGIAGIILTMGMAVDANIVIYERLREELMLGKTLRASVDAGFKRAFSAIFDSNITTMIAAGVLLWKGTGTILGFAKTLLIGVILSMICMLIVPRMVLKSLSEIKIRNLAMYGLPKKRTEKGKTFELSPVKNFKIFGTISAVICAVGLAGIILLPFGKSLFNMDIDFTGGVTMQYEIGTEVTQGVTDRVAKIFEEAAGASASSVTKSGDDGTAVVIRAKEIDSVTRDKIFDGIAAEYGADKVSLTSSDFVSASVGSDIKNSAFLASGLAALLILIYITIRFELKSGFAAIICLLHDLLVMMTAYIVFKIPMNMNFIAAALTIIGYSINATIVIFDRIRENTKTSADRSFPNIVERSINQTLRRSVGTTVTTLMPVILILIFGVSSIRNFALPLAIGLVSGTYSSVFIAGPLWSLMKGKKDIKVK